MSGRDEPGRDTGPGHVVLVGMMGTGKTTVGQLLAARLGRDFLDSDAMVEARTGHTVRELFESIGEAGFRAEETAVLEASVTADEPAVIAAAGGSVLDPANRRLIRRAAAGGGLVAWLDAPADVLARRVRTGTHRPLLEHDPLGTLTRLAAVRDPLYREVADLHLDADADPGAIADQIQAQLAARQESA